MRLFFLFLLTLAKGKLVLGKNRVFAECGSGVHKLANMADIPAQYTHPANKQCNYAYVHPTTKQCNYTGSALRKIKLTEFNKTYYSTNDFSTASDSTNPDFHTIYCLSRQIMRYRLLLNILCR